MDDKIIVAIVTSSGALLTAIIVAYINKKKETKRDTDREKQLALLGEKIFQSNILASFIPTWLMAENKFDAIAADVSDKDLEVISGELLQFIHSSIYDQWSANFFKTSYDKIPEIEFLISNFRIKIETFYKELNSVAKNKELLRITWRTILKQDLTQIRIDAFRIKDAAEKLHNESIAELNSKSKGSR